MATKFYDAKDIKVTMGGEVLPEFPDVPELTYIPRSTPTEFSLDPMKGARVEFTMERKWPTPEERERAQRMEEKVRRFQEPQTFMSVDLSRMNIRNVHARVYTVPDPKANPPSLDWREEGANLFPRKWPRELRMELSAVVSDRVTGEPIPVVLSQSIQLPLDLDPTTMVNHALRRALIQLLTHELDECLYVNGSQLHDPHEGERPRMMLIPWPKDPEAHLRNTLQPWDRATCTCGATCAPLCECT